MHDGRRAIVVDPGDAGPVLQELERQALTLESILVTHHHPDHVGGLPDLIRHHPSAVVYGPATERIPQPCTPLRGGQGLTVLGQPVEVMDVPGHTAGHIAYFLPATPAAAPVLFCGDTLFSAGCGRLFEGTAAQMHASLDRLARLPGSTRVCCAHEYTLSNLRFARTVEPDNAELQHYEQWCIQQRTAGQPTLPSSIARERAVNPFLRCSADSVQASARSRDPQAHDEVAVLAALRAWKNVF